MALIDTIQRLRQQNWSQRRIALELEIDRETVSRYLRLAEAPKPASAEEALHDSKPATAEGALNDPAPPNTPADLNDCTSCTTPSTPSPASQCAPFHAQILAKLDQGLSARRIWQDLVSEHGFTHAYHSVRRFVARLGAKTPVPFRRMECGPGEEVQVDFGQGAFLVDGDGKRRRPHVFRLVLSHSRKGYSEVVLRQTTDAFLMCLENAFWHFGGVPRRVVLDNLKAAVLQADWFDPELHPKMQAFADHYGCVFLPTKPRMPRHKGKVERGVDYVQENALKGRTFTNLHDQNEHLSRWEAEIADTRVHGTTRRAPGQHFLEVEKAALLPLPSGRLASFRESQRRVHRDGHVEVEKAYYSVPPEYVGQTVWARWDGRLVRVFNEW
jgi:transposase